MVMHIYKIIILAAGLLFSAEYAFACSCAPHRNAAEQAENYPLIFLGTAVSSEDTTPAPPPIKRSVWQRLQFWKPAPAPPPYRIQSFTTIFEVARVLKGEQAETLTLTHIGNNGALCGRNFIIGDTYLILANTRDDGTFTTGLCGLPQFPLADFETALAPQSTPVPSPQQTSPDTAPDISEDLTDVFGIWGADEAQCATSQEVREAPFVLSENTFDQYETHCDVTYTPAEPGGWTMAMSCSVEGYLETFEEWVAVIDGTLLRSSVGGATTAQEFMRCPAP